MTRFSVITCAAFFVLGAMAQAQNTRPVAPTRPTVPTVPQNANPGPNRAPVQPVQAVTPPPPSTPAVVPMVTFKDGLLTVQAVNSNLSSVVTAIRNKTGIEFEGAENVAERVAISLGPAPEGEVLAAIFSGSKYDFVALARPDSPSIVQRVILTPKSKSGSPAEAQNQTSAQAPEGDEEDAPEEQVNPDPQDTAVQPPPVPIQAAPQNQQQQQQQQPKTPEQLLQELQQMQNQKAPPDPSNPSQAPRKQPPQ